MTMMSEPSKNNLLRNMLILSTLFNIILAAFAGYNMMQGDKLREQTEEISNTYNALIESQHDMELQLNITRTELEYYKAMADYYSNLTNSNNATTSFIGYRTIPIVAIFDVGGLFRNKLQGVVLSATIELRQGEGRVLFNTIPRIGIDIQTSARTAVRAAEEITGVSLSKTDVILTISADEEVEIVDGSSAGAAITVALITMLTGREIADSVYIIGAIWFDGSIGPVEGIPQKAIAAAENGATVFIVPKDHSTVSIMGRYEVKTVNLQSYLEEIGYYITVEEAENVEEIIAKFTTN
jgi:uncharacterized protein